MRTETRPWTEHECDETVVWRRQRDLQSKWLSSVPIFFDIFLQDRETITQFHYWPAQTVQSEFVCVSPSWFFLRGGGIWIPSCLVLSPGRTAAPSFKVHHLIGTSKNRITDSTENNKFPRSAYIINSFFLFYVDCKTTFQLYIYKNILKYFRVLKLSKNITLKKFNWNLIET